MRYRVRLGGKEMENVISVSETMKNDIAEYTGLDGESFCEAVSSPLRRWDIEMLADNEEIIERLREIRDNRKTVRFSVSSAVADMSARVLLREMKIPLGYGDSSAVTISLLEYKKATARQSEEARAGTMISPPASINSQAAYQLITQYAKAGESLTVTNPDTGAEVTNLASVKSNTILTVEKCEAGTSSALLDYEEKKNKIIGDAYSIIKKLNEGLV